MAERERWQRPAAQREEPTTAHSTPATTNAACVCVLCTHPTLGRLPGAADAAGSRLADPAVAERLEFDCSAAAPVDGPTQRQEICFTASREGQWDALHQLVTLLNDSG